jgi:SAM-dependent methyltransferase
LLDAGCGQGELLIDLAAALPLAKVSGADVSPQSLRDTRLRCPDADLFVLDLAAADFDRAHIERLGSYDIVVCSEVIEHIADDRLATARLCALVRPGGHLIVTVPGGRMSRFDLAIGHCRSYDANDLRRLLEGCGLQRVKVAAWGFPFHSLYRSAVRLASRVTLPVGPDEHRDRSARSMTGAALGKGYEVFGRVMKPLFYLNLRRWGEQMFAVAQRPE